MSVKLNFRFGGANIKAQHFNGITYKFALPQSVRQEASQRLSAQQPLVSANLRMGPSFELTVCFNRVWNTFAGCINSYFKCFDSYPTDNGISSDREFRLIQDESKISALLANQMQHGMRQMQQECVKRFQYQNAPAAWDMHEKRIGGYRVGISHAQGRRANMEDEHLATSFNLTIAGRSYPIQLFGIFDGHGGRDAARYVRDNLKRKLSQALVEFNPQGLSDAGVWKALKMTTVRLNRDFKNRFGANAQDQGTTATIAMVLDQKLWTANVGDARTVLDNGGAPEQLTEDAKPADPRYRKGIEKRGGFVREVFGTPRVNGDLAVARAIGDHRFNGAISARSKITVKPLSEIQPGSHLILCCDGIYDVARTLDVVGAVHADRALAPGVLARNIVYSAYQSGSTDNLSSMVIKFL